MKSLLHIALLSCIYFEIVSSTNNPPRSYEAIFNFGDSLSDTGNFLLSGALAFPVIGKLPYGETFFRHPTGRCSDGRLVVDFIGIYTSSALKTLLLSLVFLFFFFLSFSNLIKYRNKYD